MISNDERREIAARLRMLASHKAADEELVHDTLGLYRGENIEGYDTYGVMHLADLIDPDPERTCHYESTDRCTWFCTSCGMEVDVLHYGYNYCPNCGARIIEDPN